MASPDFLGVNPFMEYLEDVPQAAYFSFQDQFGQTPRGGTSPGQKQYFQNQFQNIHNQFMGQLGRQIRSGQAPTQQFSGFMQDFPFAQRFASLPPSLRGDYSASRLSPRGRFLFF